MGKKNRNKRRDRTKNEMAQLLIELNTKSKKLTTSTTSEMEELVDGEGSKEPMSSRAKIVSKSVKTVVEGFSDTMKNVTIKAVNQKLNNGLQNNAESKPVESNSSQIASTSTAVISQRQFNDSLDSLNDCIGEKRMNMLDTSTDTVHNDYPRMFHCLHCQLTLGNQNQFKTFKEVYKHWEREHRNQLDLLPFYFYTTEYGNCVYCDHVGTYWELQKHSAIKHPSFPLAITDIINCQKCALCSYIGDDIPAHSQVHRTYRKNFSSRHLSRMTNPLTYTDETYDDRLQLRIHEKYQCPECGLAFDTELLQTQHSLYKHTETSKRVSKCNAKVIFDNSRHMVCGCCCKPIAWNTFRDHIKADKIEFPCENCSFTFTDPVDLIVHDRIDHDIKNSTFTRTAQLSNRLKKYYLSTRIIHGNGFVVTRQNITSTKYDDWSTFSDYVDGLIAIIKSRARKLEIYEKNEKLPKWFGIGGSDNSLITKYDKTKKSEISDAKKSVQNPTYISYRRSSKKAGLRILIQKIDQTKTTQPTEPTQSAQPTPPKTQKKPKPNNKTKRKNKTDHDQSGGLTTSV